MKNLIFTLFIFILSFAFALCENAYAQKNRSVKNSFKTSIIARHQAIVPVVAVADMFFACNRQRHSEKFDYQIDDLVKKTSRDSLAKKLSACLANDKLQSDVALNYGLTGCFHSQMKNLDQKTYDTKMKKLAILLTKLPRAERQKTFTKCVSKQAIYYLD